MQVRCMKGTLLRSSPHIFQSIRPDSVYDQLTLFQASFWNCCDLLKGRLYGLCPPPWTLIPAYPLQEAGPVDSLTG